MIDVQRGDHFILQDGRSGYVLNTYKNGTVGLTLILGFKDGTTCTLDCSNTGVYADDDFYYFESYFKKLGSNTFTVNKKSALPDIIHYVAVIAVSATTGIYGIYPDDWGFWVILFSVIFVSIVNRII